MGQLNVSVQDQPLSMWQTSNPLITGGYIYSVENLPGVVGANTAYVTGVIKAGVNDCTISFSTSGTSAASGTLSGYLL